MLSWVKQVHPPAFFFPESPIAALVELEEGIRLVTNIVGIEPAAMRNGMAVRVGFEKTQGGKAVPVFHPVEGA